MPPHPAHAHAGRYALAAAFPLRCRVASKQSDHAARDTGQTRDAPTLGRRRRPKIWIRAKPPAHHCVANHTTRFIRKQLWIIQRSTNLCACECVARRCQCCSCIFHTPLFWSARSTKERSRTPASQPLEPLPHQTLDPNALDLSTTPQTTPYTRHPKLISRPLPQIVHQARA